MKPNEDTFTLRLDIGQELTADKAGTIYAEWERLAAAYRAALARAELAERQYGELTETANAHGCMLTVKRHMRERKELEA